MFAAYRSAIDCKISTIINHRHRALIMMFRAIKIITLIRVIRTTSNCH